MVQEDHIAQTVSWRHVKKVPVNKRHQSTPSLNTTGGVAYGVISRLRRILALKCPELAPLTCARGGYSELHPRAWVLLRRLRTTFPPRPKVTLRVPGGAASSCSMDIFTQSSLHNLRRRGFAAEAALSDVVWVSRLKLDKLASHTALDDDHHRQHHHHHHPPHHHHYYDSIIITMTNVIILTIITMTIIIFIVIINKSKSIVTSKYAGVQWNEIAFIRDLKMALQTTWC